MSNGKWMRRFARWHTWLGWLVAIPLVLWTASGLIMVAKPIEEVRGTTLRIDPDKREPLRGNPRPIAFRLDGSPQVVELRSFVQRGRAITLATAPDGTITRYDAETGAPLPPLDETEARAVVAASIRGGDRIAAMRYLQERQAAGEVVTGLLYADPEPADLHVHLNTVDTPFNQLGERELCPGAAALETLNASLR